MSEQKDDWAVTTNRYVAYIDIMGFKDMVARSTHDEIYKMMKKIDEKKKYNENLWEINSNLVKTTSYSDSIMIYSKDYSYDSLQSIICTVSGLTNDLFIEGIPHKGTIAFGTMTLDFEKSIFFGQPLIDAYLLQEELSFYGIIAHATAEQEIENTHTKKIENLFIDNYLCPLKNGISNHLTIYPMNAKPFLGKSNPNHKKLFESIKKLRYKTSGHLRKYIDNTEAYLNFVRDNIKQE